jgi:diguanylate cyclase (GGDEF)-like protein/PAS domain S-box-containing protein
MTTPDPADRPPGAPPARPAAPWSTLMRQQCDSAVPRRLRWSLYLAFALLAAVFAWQTTRALQVAESHLQDATHYVAIAQQEVRLQWLSRALRRVQDVPDDTFAPRTIGFIVGQVESGRANLTLTGGANLGIQAALHQWDEAWRDTRLALEPLLRPVDAGGGEPLPAGAPAAPAGQPAHLADLLQVRAWLASEQSVALLAQAETLNAAVRAAALERGQALTQDTQASLLLALALLVGLLLAVVEPSVRTVRRHLARTAEQARHLELLAMVAQHTDALVMISDAKDHILWANDTFSERTGWSLDEAVGRPPSALIHHPDIAPEAVAALRKAVAEGQSARIECLNRTRDGQDLWLDCDLQVLRDERGNVVGFVSVNHDITERRRMQEQLQHHVYTDALTHLPNRAVVMQRLRRAVAQAHQDPRFGFAVLFMDFDRFKQVNDTLGHGAGDDLLRQIATRLQEALRTSDTLARVDSALQMAARLGGDEFVVVLEGVCDAAAVGQVADRLLRRLAQPYQIGPHAVVSTASIGIVMGGCREAPGGGAATLEAAEIEAQAEAMLRDADTAMYEAKRTRKGGWVLFDPSMQERVVHALRVEQDLRRALEASQLFVVYQPVVHLPGGRLAGVEALVRWRHPQRGLVPPVEFIGIAEECGLIGAVGDFVLRTACHQFAQWQRELGPAAPPRLAVNLSSAQLREPGLVPEVKWVLEQACMQPQQLQLEVTESLAAQGRQVQLTLRELKALGVKLALDDFGTGYSSLACLDQLPVDTVKIDRSFVANAQGMEYRRVLIEATIRVARTLGMATVAEGIETEAQAQHMAQLGCDMGQGYHFSRPRDAAELLDWVATRRVAAADAGAAGAAAADAAGQPQPA